VTREKKNFWLFMGPSVLIILSLVIFPLFFSINVSLKTWLMNAPLIPKKFNNFENYSRVVRDPNFLVVFRNTFIIVVLATGSEFLLGLLLAYLMSRITKFSHIMTILLVIPMMAAPVMVGIIWKMFYEPTFGFLNLFLKLIGSNLIIEWLSDSRIALVSIAISDIWEWTPFIFLILYAGIISLPKEPFEAAIVDGASGWKIFIKIIMPLLKPAILVGVLIRTIDCFKFFDVIWILTGGGPGNTTENLSMYIYHNAFKYFDLGYASALSFILLVFVMIPTTLFLRFMTKGEEIT
jgi:multiple sugar transport system permease protein